jgi:hypothetical protein
MISEQELDRIKGTMGMRTYGKLFDIKGQLMTIFNELYDMNIDTELDTQEAKNQVIRALNSVRDLMEETINE